MKTINDLDFTVFDYLNSDEMLSVLKSNSFTWEIRRLIKIGYALKSIKEVTPIIAAVVCASIVSSIISECLKKNV